MVVLCRAGFPVIGLARGFGFALYDDQRCFLFSKADWILETAMGNELNAGIDQCVVVEERGVKLTTNEFLGRRPRALRQPIYHFPLC